MEFEIHVFSCCCFSEFISQKDACSVLSAGDSIHKEALAKTCIIGAFTRGFAFLAVWQPHNN